DVVSNHSQLEGMLMLLSDGKGGHVLLEKPDTIGLRDWHRIFARDVDRDGHLDVVLLGGSSDVYESTNGLLAVTRFGDGTGSFPRHASAFLPDARALELQMADFNGDGHDDIAVQAMVGFPGEPFLAISYHDGADNFGPLMLTDVTFYYG